MSDRAHSTRSLNARLGSALATGLVIAFWLGLAPVSVGGDFSYVVVNGNSMEPYLHTGDIVLLRRDERYGLGEVVAYRDPIIGPVLHRIRSQPGDRFVVRGDNRSNADDYRPLPSDVIGREVLVWRHGLSVILALTSMPALLGMAFALIAGGVGWQLRSGQRRRFRVSRRGVRVAGAR